MKPDDLKWPHKRVELISFLEDIVALGETAYSAHDNSEIDFIVHFFFDDTNLFPNPSEEIGFFLLDSAEAKAILDGLSILNEMITELGDVSTFQYVTHGDWQRVQSKAQTALELITAN